jgi:hypothetical protein
MGKTFKTARKFSGKDGAIIVLQVLSPLKPIHPSNKPDDYHVLRIKKGKPGKEYYYIPNIRIIAILDYHGRKLI